MRRLQFELALDLSIPGGRPVAEVLARAAETAAVELLLVLPVPESTGTTAVVRFTDEGSDGFLQVKTAERGFAVVDEAGMDPLLLKLARDSVEVFKHLSADTTFRERLAAA